MGAWRGQRQRPCSGVDRAGSLTLRSIMNQTRHRSVQMVRRYIRDRRLFRENSDGNLSLQLFNPRSAVPLPFTLAAVFSNAASGEELKL